ncbi:MAG: protein kinase, partial [Candidatus Eisenbacteria bacterium]|nr:protein kinase [Candidatus Eisenbacteria bacterium]
MSDPESDILAAIAERIANGEAVDWDVLTASHPELADSIRSLQRVQALTLAHSVDDSVPSGGSRTDPSTVAPPPPRQWGALRVLERIGEGSFGQVFRAHDPVLERDVALKLRRPLIEDEIESYQHHLAEARRLARIRHPNVLPIHGVEIHDGRPGMWTEFVEGKTLEQTLQSDGPLPTEAILEIALCLARALAAVHEADLVHGDIKTENVMRRRDGHLLLMDFGAGRDRPFPDEASSDDVHGAQGTPLAMAPELLQGDPPSVASDLYALGALLFRLASGRYPIEARTFVELLEKSRKEERVTLAELRPDLPTAMTKAVDGLLAHDPRHRPDNAGAFEIELTLHLDGSAAPVPVTDDARLHGVPADGTPLIGRRSEMAFIHEAWSDVRIVGLVGAGGSGKSRLAREAARRLSARHPGGSFWVELAPVSEATEDLAGTIARSVGTRDRPGASSFDLVAGHFGKKDALLLLDNTEHVQSAAATIARRLAEACPRLHILYTSRVPFGLEDERVLSLRPLEAPPDGVRVTETQDFDAVRLFIAQARRHRLDYVFHPNDAPHVAKICRRLEGIPLAIELAAARVRGMSVPDIATRLERGLDLLMHQDATIGSVHPTLHASISWSIESLEPVERTLLYRLSVFRGGWNLSAAERVCADDEGGAIAGHPMVDMMTVLVEKSLVSFTQEADRADARYR